jgi:excisionase family DNA binding protein
MPLEKYYTILEVAEALGVSDKTIRRAIDKKAITAAKFARDWRIPESGLKAYIESRTIQAKKNSW